MFPQSTTHMHSWIWYSIYQSSSDGACRKRTECWNNSCVLEQFVKCDDVARQGLWMLVDSESSHKMSFHAMPSLTNWNQEIQGDMLFSYSWYGDEVVEVQYVIQIGCIMISPCTPNTCEIVIMILLSNMFVESHSNFKSLQHQDEEVVCTICRPVHTANKTFFPTVTLAANQFCWEYIRSPMYIFPEICLRGCSYIIHSKNQEGWGSSNMFSQCSADDDILTTTLSTFICRLIYITFTAPTLLAKSKKQKHHQMWLMCFPVVRSNEHCILCHDDDESVCLINNCHCSFCSFDDWTDCCPSAVPTLQIKQTREEVVIASDV